MKIMNYALASIISLAGCASAKPQTQGSIYAFESDANGFNTKNFFYDNGQEVVVFDAQFTPEIAQKSLEFLRTKTQNPISYVVVTHPNPDKFNGAAVFQKLGAKVIASKATAQAIPGVHAYKKYFFVEMAKMFTEATYPAEARIDITFEGQHDLRLGNGEVIALRELTAPGVSSTQTVASIASQSAIFVGDLVHHKAHAWLEGGIVNGKATPTIKGWIQDLRQLKKMVTAKTVVFGGRGESVKVGVAVKAQIAYLQKAVEIARRTKSVDATQVELEKAFPDYALGYMVKYGAYGLIDSL
jgi:glyoxylase-like metal-dependent hydrolase (beta-lactamase superfamily II)